MKLESCGLRDIFEWDVVNWAPALPFWKDRLAKPLAGARALEIGARHGGLSLWLAQNGADVVCSDVAKPTDTGKRLHERYGVADRIGYERIDARDIPYKEQFDIVAFKSVLGGVRGRFGDNAHMGVLESIHGALKPGGQLLFVENIEGCALHSSMRKRFVKWGDTWKYLRLDELPQAFAGFDSVSFATNGFVGCFGRSEWQRRWLGRVDSLVLSRLVPESWHYVLFGVATK